MSATTRIEWADKTWSPIIGCTKVSPGCHGCYAISTAHIRSFNPNPKVSVPFAGTVEKTGSGLDWTGQVNLLEERLAEPLHWRKSYRVFVNSQSDLFHQNVPDEFIAKVFAIMALTPQHTYQVLTKRHARMRSLLANPDFEKLVDRALLTMPVASDPKLTRRTWPLPKPAWPLPNVWLGVSVEDQQRANLRIPALLDTPAAVRFVSAEPLLGPVDLTPWMPPVAPMPAEQAPTTWAEWEWPDWVPTDVRARIEEFWSERWGRSPQQWIRDMHEQGAPAFGARLAMDDGFGPNPPQVTGRYVHCWNNIGRLVLDDDPGREYAFTSFGRNAYRKTRGIDWVIVGGESGPGARPMHPDWARSIRDQCVEARTAFLFKQHGEYVTAVVEDDPKFAGGRAYNGPLGSPLAGRHSATIRMRGSSGTFRAGETRLMRPGDRTRSAVMLDRDTIAVRVGKKAAGRELDGRTWDEYPDTAAPTTSRKAA